MNRKTAVVSDPSGPGIGLTRRETFTDASSARSEVDGVALTETEYLELLASKGSEDLTQNRDIKSFEGKIEANGEFKYDQHYFIGDIVQISTEHNIEAKVRITEVIKSQNSGGIDIYLTVETVE